MFLFLIKFYCRFYCFSHLVSITRHPSQARAWGCFRQAPGPPLFLGAWSPPLLRLVSLVAVALATVQAPTPSVGPPTRFGVQASGASPFAPPAIPRRESHSANINRCQVRWQRLMFSEAAPRPRSRHSPCWGPSCLVRSSPSSCLTRNGCFTGFFLIIFPALPFPFPLSSVQSPFVLFVTPPALVGVTRCKGTQCGRSCLSNHPSTYPLGRAPNSLRGPGLWCLALCTPCKHYRVIKFAFFCFGLP